MNIVNFVLGHEVILASLGVAVLDLIFALNQSAESNGILHFVYVALKNIIAPKQQ